MMWNRTIRPVLLAAAVLALLLLVAAPSDRVWGGEDEPALAEARAMIRQLEAERGDLEAQLRALQERHARDVAMLQAELVRANEVAEGNRLHATGALADVAVLREEVGALHAQNEQLRAERQREGAPTSLQSVLGHVPLEHWLRDLRAFETLRRDVALSVLEVRLPGTVGDDASPRWVYVRKELQDCTEDDDAKLAARARRLLATLGWASKEE